MKNIPNALTLLRGVIIGPLITLLAMRGTWKLAFAMLLVGLATDWLDGYLATRFNAKSHFGARVLEPLCDFGLGAGGVAGLLVTENLPWWSLYIFGAIGAIIWPGLLKPTTTRINRLSTVASVVNFMGILVFLMITYARLAFAPNEDPIIILIGTVIGVAAAWKQHRIKAWIAMLK